MVLTSTNAPDPVPQTRERKPVDPDQCVPAKPSQGWRVPFLGEIRLEVGEVSPRILDRAF